MEHIEVIEVDEYGENKEITAIERRGRKRKMDTMNRNLYIFNNCNR